MHVCCGKQSHHGYGHPHGAACGCGCGSHAGRRFQTKDEKVERLEQYLESLRKEAQAVQEHIAALQEG
jgi:hypothetical protein